MNGKCEVVLQWKPNRTSCGAKAVAYYASMGGGRMYLCEQHVQKHMDSAKALELRHADTEEPYGWTAFICKHCGHAEEDHDGYGGMCDGLGGNDSRAVCGCMEYRSL